MDLSIDIVFIHNVRQALKGKFRFYTTNVSNLFASHDEQNDEVEERMAT